MNDFVSKLNETMKLVTLMMSTKILLRRDNGEIFLFRVFMKYKF